tara:strand:+ start:1142 stop:1306 length:165 start_codon:yes stop_codon:yes gene_type:complete
MADEYPCSRSRSPIRVIPAIESIRADTGKPDQRRITGHEKAGRLMATGRISIRL